MAQYRVTFGTSINIAGKTEMTGFSDTTEAISLINAIGKLARKHDVWTTSAISAELLKENA